MLIFVRWNKDKTRSKKNMEACGIATKFHSTALQTHSLNKSKLFVKPQTHLYCKSSRIILSKYSSASSGYQRWPRPYRYAIACCCSNESNSFAAQADTEAGHDRTVRVKLILQKECEFGEDFCVVGEEAILGSWNPQLAIPMTWSSGHIWTTPTMDVPLGRRIYFKFILRDKEGEFHWQPGPDRVFETWETRTTLLVSQDWYDFDLQTITEAETEQQAITETLGETETEDQSRKVFAETKAGIVERGEIKGGVPVLVPGLAPMSFTDQIASRETLGATENEDRVVGATQEEFPESRDRIAEITEINGGVPVLVPGLASIYSTDEDCSSTGEVPGAENVSTTDEDCSSTGEVPGVENVSTADIDCLTKQVEYPGKSPLAISATQEVDKQQQQQRLQHQESSSYVENGSVTRNNHASLSGEDEALTSGATEVSVTVESGDTSSAKELNENKNTGDPSESSCNEQENFITINNESESDSSVLQKDFDWGRAALFKLIWSLGIKDE